MEIKVGDRCKLRNGSIATITSIDNSLTPDYPIRGQTTFSPHTWTMKGFHWKDKLRSDYDIVEILENGKMQIEVGKFYKTRGGRKARIYALDGDSKDPIHGAILLNLGWVAKHWKNSGSYTVADNHPYDIISEWVERPVVGWNALPPGILSVAIDGDNEACGCLYPKMDLYGKYWAGPVNNNISSINVIPIKREIITFTGDWKHSLAIRPGYEKNKK